MRDASGLDRLDAGRPRRPAISLIRCAPAPIVSSSGRSAVAGGISLQQQPVGLAVQGSRRVQDQRVHRGVEIVAERLRKLPVTGHPTPQRVCADQISRPVECSRLAQKSGLQWLHGEGFVRPAVQRRAGVEYRAVHHVQARAADDDAQAVVGAV